MVKKPSIFGYSFYYILHTVFCYVHGITEGKGNVHFLCNTGVLYLHVHIRCKRHYICIIAGHGRLLHRDIVHNICSVENSKWRVK